MKLRIARKVMKPEMQRRRLARLGRAYAIIFAEPKHRWSTIDRAAERVCRRISTSFRNDIRRIESGNMTDEERLVEAELQKFVEIAKKYHAAKAEKAAQAQAEQVLDHN